MTSYEMNREMQANHLLKKKRKKKRERKRRVKRRRRERGEMRKRSKKKRRRHRVDMTHKGGSMIIFPVQWSIIYLHYLIS